MLPRTLRRDERGFTLIEVLVTMVILAVGIGGTLALIDGANARTSVNKQREGANALTREVLENARSVPYQKLTPGGIVSELQALPGMADSDGGTLAWTIERRNVTYTVAASVCAVDDPQDNLGDHTGANFCAGAAGTADRNPDDYRRVTVEVSWKSRGEVSRQVKQTALIANETNASGPGLEIVAQDPNTTEVTSDSVDGIVFTVETTEIADAIKYTVDGVVKRTSTPGGRTDEFDWRIDGGADGHLPDGTYVIAATAYDDRGRPGPSRSRTIKLNRDEPLPVSNQRGGWNALRSVVELEWDRNPEPDIRGYRVYRQVGSATPELVSGCAFDDKPSATSCVDFNPLPDDTVQYYVVALDTDPFTLNPREGAVVSSVTATRSKDQPNQPSSLSASVVDGDVVLNWTVPVPPAPDYAGSSVIFYRIYRDGQQVADRIGISTDTKFKDAAEGANAHSYWLTAVDEHYSESTLLGPVTTP